MAEESWVSVRWLRVLLAASAAPVHLASIDARIGWPTLTRKVRTMRVATLLCLLSLFAASANATMIVIEPDDYALGSPITHEQATVIGYQDHQPMPVFASTATLGGFGAPTGSAHFGNLVTTFASHNEVPWYGVVFQFAMPVDSVSILALNYGYGPGLHLDCSVWLVGATDRSGGCDGGLISTAVGETRLYNLSFGGQAFDRITFGGGSGIGAFIFDRLEAHVVPEPATAILLATALLGMAGAVRWRRKAAKV